MMNSAFGLYIHIPFCKRICAYCDFFKEVGTARLPALVEGLHRELDRRAAEWPYRHLRTLYLGGGTPSLCSAEQIASLIRHARQLFDASQLTEVTLEANPDDLSLPYLEALRAAGVNRLSIGIQSFDDDCLRLMNRRHNAAQAEAAIRMARQAGFDNLTIDLIYGVPGFGGEKLARSLDHAIESGVEHISAYHLTIEPDTAFGRRMSRGGFAPVSEEVSEEEFLTVHRRLSEAGWEHYEISNFARAGFRALHNAAYWEGVPYLGLGPGAHSFDGQSRWWNVASVERYLAGEEGEREVLDRRDRYNETVMTRLRTAEGIRLARFEEMFGAEGVSRLLEVARPLIEQHALTREPDRIYIPAEHFLTSDAVIEALFES